MHHAVPSPICCLSYQYATHDDNNQGRSANALQNTFVMLFKRIVSAYKLGRDVNAIKYEKVHQHCKNNKSYLSNISTHSILLRRTLISIANVDNLDKFPIHKLTSWQTRQCQLHRLITLLILWAVLRLGNWKQVSFQSRDALGCFRCFAEIYQYWLLCRKLNNFLFHTPKKKKGGRKRIMQAFKNRKTSVNNYAVFKINILNNDLIKFSGSL